MLFKDTTPFCRAGISIQQSPSKTENENNGSEFPLLRSSTMLFLNFVRPFTADVQCTFKCNFYNEQRAAELYLSQTLPFGIVTVE